MGSAHQIITPLWQIYGQMEILMVYATVRQLVKTSHAEIRNWRQDIFFNFYEIFEQRPTQGQMSWLQKPKSEGT